MLSRQLYRIAKFFDEVENEPEVMDGCLAFPIDDLKRLASLLTYCADEAAILERAKGGAEILLADIGTADGKVVRFADYRHRAKNAGDAA